MDKKVTALLIRAKDMRDYDKSVHLFSANEGMLVATMRGVRRPTAKMKFACQPFAFCEYELAEKNGNYTVTGASTVGDLFPLTQTPEKFFAGSVVTEIVECTSLDSDSATLFVVALKTLKAILVNNGDYALMLAKFVQKVLSINGVLPQLNPHSSADNPETLLYQISRLTMDEVVRLKPPTAQVRQALRQTVAVFERAFEVKLKSI
ncbi:MAG: DNA repair protein RecO, partial [Clostridia bacterium]|nr:DNA repair protein RecO [Clostridia bacterium]